MLGLLSIGIIEKKYFSGKTMDELIHWIEERSSRELQLQLTGIINFGSKKGESIDLSGRIIDTRRGVFRKRVSVLLDELNLPSQEYELDQVITLGGEASRTEDIRLKQATVFHLVKRAMKEDRYFDGDQLNESIRFIQSTRESGSFLAEVWGSEFESRKPIHIKGLVTDARVEYGQIELLDIMVKEPGKRKPQEKIYTVGSAELPYIWLLQQAVERVKPDIVARKLHLKPTYEKETPRYTNIVEAKNLTVRYGRNMVFERLSFEMKEGEILGIIGESGAGKTTLIKTLLREIKPQRGTAIIAGVDTSEMGEIKPQIGFVPQELSHMYDTFTPLEN
ncbi:MAG: ATP-binding cassette domain-containing protein, partial [Candidatus Ranarchaeia archaeon]